MPLHMAPGAPLPQSNLTPATPPPHPLSVYMQKLDQLLNATVGVPAVRLSHEALLWDSYQGRSSEGELRFASGTSSISSSRDSSSGATLIKRQPSYLKHVLQTASAAQVRLLANSWCMGRAARQPVVHRVTPFRAYIYIYIHYIVGSAHMASRGAAADTLCPSTFLPMLRWRRPGCCSHATAMITTGLCRWVSQPYEFCLNGYSCLAAWHPWTRKMPRC